MKEVRLLEAAHLRVAHKHESTSSSKQKFAPTVTALRANVLSAPVKFGVNVPAKIARFPDFPTSVQLHGAVQKRCAVQLQLMIDCFARKWFILGVFFF